MKYRVVIAILVVWLLLSETGFAQTVKKNHRLTASEISSIKTAIEDEIYDYGYNGSFYQIGENEGTASHWISRVQLFLNPIYSANQGYGEVIYKLMPIGQIYRHFFFDANGTVHLDGDPENRFPITQPSRQTVFMSEDEICRDEHLWLKRSFSVDVLPNPEIVTQAARRQKIRTGFSAWQAAHPNEHD